MYKNPSELMLHLQDEEFPFEYTDHHRLIARAVVFDGEGYFYFVRTIRVNDFGTVTLLETPGGGVEEGEALTTAVLREVKEELGATVEIVCKLGVVEDYYNRIHRHNINHYFLCRVISFAEKKLTPEERKIHMSTLKLSCREALLEYEKYAVTKFGRLVAKREVPVLEYAKTLLDHRPDAE